MPVQGFGLAVELLGDRARASVRENSASSAESSSSSLPPAIMLRTSSRDTSVFWKVP
jgi:hypothetical protein